MRVWLVLLFCSLVCCGRCQALDVYHVGNSFLWAINHDAMDDWAASRGSTYNYGYHIANGKNLSAIWQQPNRADFMVEPYGTVDSALTGYDWDVVTFEPFDVWDPWSSDEIVIGNFVDLMLTNPDNRSTQAYIFESQPFQARLGSSTYSEFWDQPWDGNGLSWSVQTRDYYQKLAEALNASETGLEKDILLVPVGDVLYALDRRMRAGDVPGYTSVLDLYWEGVHLTPDAGFFVTGATFYATMYHENPTGLAIPPDILTPVTPEFAAIVQRVVWEVVAGHPYSGVAAELDGDFNGDRIVDLADYAVWKSTYGSKLDFRADANLDFVVDVADYTIWRNNCNLSNAEIGATIVVPEPSTSLVLVAAISFGGYARRRVRF